MANKYLFCCGEVDSGMAKIHKIDAETMTYIAGSGITFSINYGLCSANVIISDGYYLYAIESNGDKIGKLDFDLNEISVITVGTGTYNKTLAQDNTYLYCGSALKPTHLSTLNRIRKSDMVVMTPTGYTGNTTGCNHYNICVDDNYLYVIGNDIIGGFVRKIDKNTFVQLSQHRSGGAYTFSADYSKMVQDTNYLYIIGQISGNWSILKLSKSDLNTIVDSVAYTNGFCGLSIDSIGNIFGNRDTLNKYDSATLTLQASETVSPVVASCQNNTIDDNYVYLNNFSGITYINRITKYNKSDCSYVDECIVNIPNTYFYTIYYVEELPTIFPPSFCETAPYTISGSTCGNADGMITIPISPIYTSYFDLYDFTLTDVWGTSYTFNTTTGEATGLTSNYYFLTATVKPAYWGYYGRDDCYFKWIKVEDSDNPAFLVGVSIRPQQCQPFDVQHGRIYYSVSGLSTGNTYSFYAFTEDLTLYYQKTGCTSTEDFLLANCKAQCYWVLIRDEVSGCALLLDNRCVPSVPMYSLGGIKKLYLAKWSDDIDYNYWNTKDDDYFLEFIDTSFFTSTKLKEILSLTGGTTGVTWYRLPIAPQVATVSQKLEKVQQGFIFTDTLTVAIAAGNATKWKQMATLINPENKWIYIVQDSDGFWWTGGYRHGARISAYSFKNGLREEDNGYNLTITAISENKLLTNIDEDYVINYVE